MLKYFKLTISLCLLNSALAFAQDIENTVRINMSQFYASDLLQWKYQPGDQIEWAQPEFPDSLWETIQNQEMLKRQYHGIYWLRTHINLAGDQKDADILALSIYNVGTAYEVYWDGALIIENGKVSINEQTAYPGNVRQIVRLGKSKTSPGQHILALRVLSFRNLNLKIPSGITLGYYTSIQAYIQERVQQQLFYFGLYFTATLFCISLFLSGWKHSSFLYFGGYTLVYCLLSAWVYLIEFNLVSTSLFNIVEPLIIHSITITLLLLNLFILSHFEISRKWMHVSIMVVILLLLKFLIPHFSLSILLSNTIMSCYAFGLILSKSKEKLPGNIIAMIGFSVLILYYGYIAYTAFTNSSLFKSPFAQLLIEIFFMSCIIISISRKIQDQHHKYHQIRLRSQRLETELLKKSIQPHFIMNTLLSIKSWFSKDSKTAERLVETLSEEFQIINRIAAKREIPVSEEIELCQRHLELMGYRRDAKYQLIVNCSDNGKMIPPMVFHTLIENGLTHAYKPKENGTFCLSCMQKNGTLEYLLSNDGSRLEKMTDMPFHEIEEGMGFKYVKARLEESFPGKWHLNYGLSNGKWEVKIGFKE